jgi:hypothetical protein
MRLPLRGPSVRRLVRSTPAFGVLLRRPSARSALGLAVLAALLLSALPASAQPVTQPAADAAAAALEDDLRPLSLVAATAALIRQRTGSLPLTPFDLLGAPEAARTGLRDVQFAALSTPATDDGVPSVVFTLGGTEADASEWEARVVTLPDVEAGGYAARFTLTRHHDADFGGRRMLLARVDPLEVRDASGRLCLSTERLLALPDAAAFAATAPYFGDRGALSVSFDAIPGGEPVAESTLPTPGGRP